MGVVGVEGDRLNVVGMRETTVSQRTNGHVVEVIWKQEKERLIISGVGKVMESL